jgi:hypothetical protein
MAGDARRDEEAAANRRRKSFLFPLLTGAALVSGCSSLGDVAGSAASVGPSQGCSSPGDLSGFSDFQLEDLAQACRAAARDVRASNLQAAVANYRAGRAWRAQGQYNSGFESPEVSSAPVWRNASAALEAALANLNPPAPGARATREGALIEDTWVGAKLELAQVRAFMWDWDAALQHATDVYERFTDGRQAEAMHRRAEIYLLRYGQDPNPSYREQAFNDLSRFSSAQYDNHPNAREARLEVVSLAKTLGERALADRSLAQARNIFAAGREAAEAMRRMGDSSRQNELDVAAFNLGLGKVEVLRAGLRGPDELGGCEGRPLYPADLNRAVTDNLNAATALPEAHRWAGCALLALDQLGPAIARFRDAAAAPEGRANANTQISLARALREASRNQASGGLSLDYRNQSLVAYDDALSLLQSDADAEKRAAILVEAADGVIEYARTGSSREWRPERCEARISAASANDPLARADSPAYACAVSMLQEAARAAPESGEAFLQLGAIYGDMIKDTPEGPRLNSVFTAAFSNADEAVRKAGANNDLRARANFQLSRIAEEAAARRFATAPAGRARGAPRRLSDVAIGSADEAARLAPERYSSQACLVRLYFRRTEGDGARYCETDSANPVALLYEGMFYLRETYRLRGVAQSAAWESALESFEAGVAALDADLTGATPPQERERLRGRLMAGQGYVYTCAGFRNAGQEILANRTQDADAYFIRYGFRDCAARRN